MHVHTHTRTQNKKIKWSSFWLHVATDNFFCYVQKVKEMGPTHTIACETRRVSTRVYHERRVNVLEFVVSFLEIRNSNARWHRYFQEATHTHMGDENTHAAQIEGFNAQAILTTPVLFLQL